MCDIAYVNNTAIIARNPQVTAINSCIEVDITGQVVSDSIGTYMYSGEYSPHLFTFVFNPDSAGIDFRLQKPSYSDV